MSFLVTEAARATGIFHPVVAVFRNLKPTADTGVYTPIINSLESRTQEAVKAICETPEFKGYKTLYTTLGHPDIVTAGERLSQNGFPRRIALVEAYNIVAFQNLEGLGCHDVSSLPSDFTLIFKRACGEEQIHSSLKSSKQRKKLAEGETPYKAENIAAGDLTYGFYQEKNFIPLAWMGTKDIDNKLYQLHDNTSAMLFTAIGNEATSLEYNIKVCEDVLKYLTLTSPEATMELRIGEFTEDTLNNEETAQEAISKLTL